MNKFPAAAINLTLLTLSLSMFGSQAYARQQDFLAQNGLSGKSTHQLVDYINQMDHDKPMNFSAGITSTELRLTDGKKTFTYPVGDKFYLSFAPYIHQTHPCFNHNLTSCRGELSNTAFNVHITDPTGKVIVAKTLISYQNGFIGVWLPRNITGTITVSYNGLSASAPITTGLDSQTCLTGLKLTKAV